jgi:hypothetical protein
MAAGCMGSSCFAPEAEKLALKKSGLKRTPLAEESFPRRYYPDRVRGYFLSPAMPRSTPVSTLIETPCAMILQIAAASRRS